jgi:hypothetical protein
MCSTALDGPRLPLEVSAQVLRHRQDPLTDGEWRKDMVDEVGRGLRHAARVARGAQPAFLAGECDEEIVSALPERILAKPLAKIPRSRYRRNSRPTNAGTA